MQNIEWKNLLHLVGIAWDKVYTPIVVWLRLIKMGPGGLQTLTSMGSGCSSSKGDNRVHNGVGINHELGVKVAQAMHDCNRGQHIVNVECDVNKQENGISLGIKASLKDGIKHTESSKPRV
jgi:hypothetical protein